MLFFLSGTENIFIKIFMGIYHQEGDNLGQYSEDDWPFQAIISGKIFFFHFFVENDSQYHYIIDNENQ